MRAARSQPDPWCGTADNIPEKPLKCPGIVRGVSDTTVACEVWLAMESRCDTQGFASITHLLVDRATGAHDVALSTEDSVVCSPCTCIEPEIHPRDEADTAQAEGLNMM